MKLSRNRPAQIIIFILIITFMSNLNAIVDAILHPDIPYLDEEHLIVGAITGLVNSILFGIMALYVRYLNSAIRKIESLEILLPICSHCKKIRKPDSDPDKQVSWQTVESYITEKTSSEFTHGICPACVSKHYTESRSNRSN